MEFNEKLQELRKNKNLTQEQLAEMLFVSRTAISKWESGRGYPSIDSLKEISNFLQYPLMIYFQGKKSLLLHKRIVNKESIILEIWYCSVATYFFLPIFAQNTGDVIESVSLLSYTKAESYIIVPYMIIVIGLILCGVITLALQNCTTLFWIRIKSKLSLSLSVLATLFFMLSRQPYAGTFILVFMIIKTLMLIKWT